MRLFKSFLILIPARAQFSYVLKIAKAHFTYKRKIMNIVNNSGVLLLYFHEIPLHGAVSL